MATGLKPRERTDEERNKELLPAGNYRVRLVNVGDVQESTFKKKNGDPANDYAYLTFQVRRGKQKGKKFDSAMDWLLETSVDKHGNRTWTSALQNCIEAFLGRELDEDDDGEELLADIMRDELEADASVEVRKGKQNPDKVFNKVILMSAIEDDDEDAPPNKERGSREILKEMGNGKDDDLDEVPF